jgi:hypothetical protein
MLRALKQGHIASDSNDLNTPFAEYRETGLALPSPSPHHRAAYNFHLDGRYYLAKGFTMTRMNAIVVRRVGLFALLILAASVGAQPATMPAGATALLNGKDLTGWRLYLEGTATDPKSVWTIADGVLQTNTKTRGYFATDKAYSDYHLHVEWRWPKDAPRNANSGVMIHLTGPDVLWPKSFECQLQNNNAGQIVGMDNDIPAAPMQQNRKRAARLAQPSEKPLGEWNTYDIHAKGDTIEVFVNGVRQNKVEKISSTSGQIALQLEGFPIDFRNVWLVPE